MGWKSIVAYINVLSDLVSVCSKLSLFIIYIIMYQIINITQVITKVP